MQEGYNVFINISNQENSDLQEISDELFQMKTTKGIIIAVIR